MELAGLFVYLHGTFCDRAQIGEVTEQWSFEKPTIDWN